MIECSRIPSCKPEFDPKAYWNVRLGSYPDLQGTGSYFAPIAWQRWLYKGKERAYVRLLRRSGVRVHGRHVVDFGCGTGYFEDFWEKLGARRADGVDIVPEVIDRLQRSHPHRKYLCADVSDGPSALVSLGKADIVTAIDVLYHIVDDAALFRTLQSLLSILGPRGCILFTDALQERPTAEHVRFRSRAQWDHIMASFNLRLVGVEPVFVINNRLFPGLAFAPGLAGALQHCLDTFLLPLLPHRANNYALLAQHHR